MLKKSTLLFIGTFFLLFFGLSDYGYACHGEGPPHPPDCGNKGKGEGKTHNPTVTTLVQWGGPYGSGRIKEDALRPCVAAQLAQNGDYGSYVCQVGGMVHYALEGGVQTARKGDLELCEVFSDVDLTPDRLYNYGWSDDCGDGACTIQISNWFFDDNGQLFDATDRKVDFIRFVAKAEAEADFMDANPFVDFLRLEVDQITIMFNAADSNKIIAVCEYSLERGNLGIGEVIFLTDPMPLP